MSLPVVAIVGRPNVGKSTLLNTIAGRLISIVDPTPGVTRDRVSVRAEHGGRRFELVDTGGIGIVDSDRLENHINQQIELALVGADVLVLLLDVRDGVTALDQEVVARLRKLDKPLILVGNKVDSLKQERMLPELYSLGLGEPIGVSARERYNTGELLDRIVELLPPADQAEDAPESRDLKLAIVGKPNAGKSTLVNKLAGEDRVIVSEVPGTTRDAVDLRIQWQDRTLVLIDTAGMKKAKQVSGSVAFYGQERSQRAVRRADAVLLMLDASSDFSQVDRKIAALVRGSKKPCAIVINKWDIAQEQGVEPDQYLPYIEQQLPGLGFAPIVFVSARDELNVWGAIEMAWMLYQQSGTRVGTGELNRVIDEAWKNRKPKVKKNRLPKIYYATQVEVHPPTIVLFVNDPKLFSSGYQRYLTNRLRQELPFSEVPIQLFLRKSGEKRAAELASRR